MIKRLLLLFLLVPQIAFAGLPNYCHRLQLPGWWGSIEYLYIWRKERFYPPLVTTSPQGTPVLDAGILGLPTTSILFGDERKGRSPTSGARFDAGFWLTPCIGFGATWEVLGKEHIDKSFNGDENGNPILAVPYFQDGVPMAYLVSFPGVQAPGSIDIHTTNHVWVADAYSRWRFIDRRCIHLDFLGGFRYSHITDSLDLTTQFLVIDGGDFDGFTFESCDHYNTENNFYSGLIGVIGEFRTKCWAIQASGKFGLGNMVKQAEISGQVLSIDPLGNVIVQANRLLSGTNFGNYHNNDFQVVMEGNAQLQCHVWRNMMVTAGYQFIYWPRIYLAGDQVDQYYETPQPSFKPQNSHFWAQGITLGIYFLY